VIRKVASRVDERRAARYRAEGLWDDRTLADGIEAAAKARPGALAVADAERHLTYGELAPLVARQCEVLAARDLGPDRSVVLVAGNTVAAVVAYHALVRLGATVALLDRRCGRADVRHAIDRTSASAVLLPRAERSRLLPDGADTAVLVLEDLEERDELTVPAEGAARVEPDRDAPAVVLFTSGTTDRPKGVVHSLNTLTAGVRNMAQISGVDATSVLFLVSPLASITGVTQMHLCADCHSALVLEDDFDPAATLERLDAAGATLLGGAPVIAERLLRAAQQRADHHISVRTLALGGAMLPRPLLDLAATAFGIDIVRVYGSSEAPCVSGSAPGDDLERRLADDGELLPGTEVRVGSADHPQEGLVRGPAVFAGYLDPADDAAAFDGDWYRTGDLVEVHDGRLTVIGRLKEVVNRNGVKVSLNEVEAALAAVPGVVELACFALPDQATGERLAVAMVAEDGADVTLARVVAHLLDQGLAKHKLPEQLVTWDEPLPRTPSGKVVRSRLVMDYPAKASEVAARLGSPR
jgi:acyl-CoA synthetase (AMP-forming)/AMP-acid ligase II